MGHGASEEEVSASQQLQASMKEKEKEGARTVGRRPLSYLDGSFVGVAPAF